MGLIYGKKIPSLRKGYPTVSDKYNVAGGRLGGSAAVEMGALLAFGTESGLFIPATAADSVCGVALASNVKLTNTWTDATTETVVMPGEAANLCFDGYVAVKIGEHGTAQEDAELIAQVTPGAPCYFADGAVAVSADTLLPGFRFTGVAEVVGTEILAEVEIHRVMPVSE